METNTRSKKLIYVLVAVVLILLALIVYFLFFRPTSGTNNTNNNSTPTPTQTSTVTATPTDEEEPTPSTTITSTPTPTTSVTITSTPSVTGTLSAPIQVKVIYSVGDNPTTTGEPNSLENFAWHAFRQFRTSRADTEAFVMEKMIEGPSESDKTNYYWFTPIKLNGNSNCGGGNFVITKDTATNKTTVQFCKALELGGVGDSARVNTVVRVGMEQFLAETAPKKVVILDQNGNCVGDESGQNRCKN